MAEARKNAVKSPLALKFPARKLPSFRQFQDTKCTPGHAGILIAHGVDLK
jgi:hypothetical protein